MLKVASTFTLVLLSGCHLFYEAGPDDLPTMKPNRAFISIGTFTGNLGGFTGADNKCQVEADQNTLGGQWRALLKRNGAAKDFGDLENFTGWQRLDGVPLLNEIRDAGNKIWNPLTIGPDGSAIVSGNSWTGFGPNGSDCGDWTVETAAPSVGAIGESFSQSNFLAKNGPNKPNADCNDKQHLYCFEIGSTKQVALGLASPAAKVIFLSTANWQPTGDLVSPLQSADTLCSTEGNAVRTGTYKALLPAVALSGGTSAIARANAQDVYVRPDGAVVGKLDSAPLTFINMHANKDWRQSLAKAWTFGEPSSTPDPDAACPSSGDPQAATGNPDSASSLAWSASTSFCSAGLPVYCVQQ
jgi:hypothetical protein